MVNFLRRGWVWTLKDSCFLENRVLRLESCCSTNTVTYGDSLMVCPLDTTVGPPSAFPPDSANLVHSGSWTVFIESFQAPATDWVCCTQSIAGRYLTIRRCTVVENSRERTRINSVFFKRNQNRNCVGDDQWSSAFHALDLALGYYLKTNSTDSNLRKKTPLKTNFTEIYQPHTTWVPQERF